MKTKHLLVSFALGLGLSLALLWLLGGRPAPVTAAPALSKAEGPAERPLRDATPIHYVATTGTDSGDCSTPANACRTIQYAVDQAGQGDEVRVAAGTYTDVNVRPRNDITTTGVVIQVVYISKTVVIRGGYTTTDWTTPDPDANPTTLDAGGQGRVLYITALAPGAGISPTVEGLRITGGDAAGLGGDRFGNDVGGGVYVYQTRATISGCRVTINAAPTSGGGVYLLNSDDATLSGNTVSDNTADYGGGLYLRGSAATLSGNTISANTAYTSGGGLRLFDSDATLSENTVSNNTAHTSGGGLALRYSAATLSENTISNNSANDGGGLYLLDNDNAMLSGNTISANTAYTSGGGLYLRDSAATLSENIISDNSANNDGGGLYLSYSDNATLSDNTISANTAFGTDWNNGGGGLYLDDSDATLSGNTVSNNIANENGGGLYLYESDDATLSRNSIVSNTANFGGGLYLRYSDATLSRNTVSTNTADFGGGLRLLRSAAALSGNTVSANTADFGGGLALRYSDATLTNNIVADNQASITGSGLHIAASSPRLLHSTIVRNSGAAGSGVYVTNAASDYSTVALTNTILVRHTVGIIVTSGNIATLEATLWGSGAWANENDWSGAGTVTIGPVNIWGDPAFMDPDARDYHIGLTSAAIDQGVNAGVDDDIDGEPRPQGDGYEIGADETGLVVTKQADPDRVQAGEQLTYTIYVTNTGNFDLHATVTDTLPTHVTVGKIPGGTVILPGGQVIWMPLITAPGGVWTATVVVTVDVGYAGPLTNVVEVTTAEGVTGIYTHTLAPDLEVAKQANPDPAQAGERLAYTIYVTNTGNFDLHAIITDTLPAHVTPTGVRTWNATIPAPDGVWMETVVVTVEMGYAGPLTNVVEVTTAEGATGVYTETVLSLAPHLEVTKEAAPDPVQAGEQLTYTIRVTNTGNMDLHATITDTLPEYAIPTGLRTWTPTIPAPGGIWTEQFTVTVEMGYAGPLTNVVQVTTEEGATGVYTEISEARVTPALIVTKQAHPDPVQAGAQLAYTIRVTNTGNVDLHAIITDTLPTQVTPAGVRTWTPTIPAPGGVWTETVVVIVEWGYAGPLTNVVQVTTEEGATGAYTETSEAKVTPALSVIKRVTPKRVEAGKQLTYTIHVTNTGNVDLHATITDTLPTHVTPTGVRTWTATIPAPGGVWAETVVVTVETGYVGPLTNVVEVTTDEGATGVYTYTLAPALEVTKQAAPDRVQAGEQLTYTIYVTNTGSFDLHTTIIDTLPAHVTPTGVRTWTPTIPAPGGVWTETIVVTVEMGYAGPLTNVVQVTTAEGATGVYIHTLAPDLEVTKQADPDPVQAGAQLTYTIRVTNTGNFDLHATITDTLPAHVTPTGVRTWTPTIPAPGGVWTETVVATVEWGYAGPLTNVVQVTTAEGATGVYTATSTALFAPPNRAPYTPSNPIPTDGARGVPITQTLRWQGGDPDGDPVTYSVAFGTSDPPPFATTTTLTSYAPTDLVTDTTYYWVITASDGISTSVGPMWHFATVGPAEHAIYLPLVLRQYP